MMKEQPACRSLSATDPGPSRGRWRGGRSGNNRGARADRTAPSRGHHVGRCVLATMAILATICPPLRGQGADSAPPKPADAMLMFSLVDRWVRGWNVPETAPGYVPVVPGACVTLRLDGEIVGRGEAFGVDSVWRGLRSAMAEAEERITVDHDALREARLLEAVSRISISLELAGAATPLPARNIEEVAGQCTPGLDGVMLRAGEWEGAVFPGRMLAFSQEPAMAVAGLLTSAREAGALPLSQGPDPTGKELASLLERGLVRISRFRVTHIAQPMPAESPVFLFRGGREVSGRWASTANLRAFAEEMGDHLLMRQWAGVEKYGLMGRYLPALGRYSPDLASPAEQAIAALALLRLGRSAWIGEGAGTYAEGGVRLLSELSTVEPGEPDPVGSAGAAACIAGALVEVGAGRVEESPELGELLVLARRRLVGAFSVVDGFEEGIAEGEMGAVVWGLARLASVGMASPETARSALREMYTAVPPDRLVAQFPWLAWVELELARGGEVTGIEALRQVRGWVWKSQVRWDGLPDEVGAILLTQGGVSLATWGTARPLAGLARMAADERVTSGDERLLELARVLEGVRFLRQLAADGAVGHMYVSPGRARGGVRAAIHDQRMPPDATSLSLLAVLETLEALEKIGANSGG